MPDIDRRRFLQLAGGSIATTMLSDSIARALAIPAHRATRSIRDIEHIVVLMQENRSFDHYYGVLRGVRGYGDPHPVTLPSGKPVWFQAEGSTVVPPFRPDVGNLALTFIEDLDHSWNGTHEMFNGGKWDQWLPSKTTTCMAHMERADLPFHYALADAFTVCDANHCSMLGPTDPNRYYMWTGWDGNDGKGGGPVIANDELGYDWMTYPERLEQAGTSWKIYQDIGEGLDAADFWGFTEDPFIGNFGDNSLLYFHQYQNAAPGSPLFQKPVTGTDIKSGGGLFDILEAEVKSGALPEVSWIVGPQAYTEHPAFPPGYGAFYTAQVLNALTSNPEVWSKTALLITFDENDGFFDHVVGAYPNVDALAGDSTVALNNELFEGKAGTPGGSDGVVGPYGLGVRVPLIVVSPWSPAVGSVPAQEPGVRPSRRLGYRFHAGFHADSGQLHLEFKNHGVLGVGIQARSLTVPGAPYSYTVGAGDKLVAQIPNPGTYDLSLHGPNGFFRQFAGSPATGLRVEVRDDQDSGRLRVRVIDTDDRSGNGRHKAPVTVDVADAYGPDRQIRLNGEEEFSVDTHHSGGWYDIALSTPGNPSFAYQFAGRLESAWQLTSDPQLGR